MWTRGALVGGWMLAVGCAEEPPTEAGDPTSGATATEPSFAEYAADGETVAQVEPGRYLGLWYEIATTGSFQQQTCAGTTATYSLLDDVTVEVYNRCLLGGLDGPVNDITGTATAVDETFARLLVDFGFGFDAPYDIVELDGSAGDEPYQFAGVSSFSGGQLWVLARTPSLDPEVFDAIVERFEDRGYADPRGRLVLTEHAEAR